MRFEDPAAEFVPAVERVFGTTPRILDGSRAVLVPATAINVGSPAGCKPSHPGVLGRRDRRSYRGSLRPWAARFSHGRAATGSQSQAQIGDVKLSLEAGERELWLVRVLPPALEDWVAKVDVGDDIEDALREARELMNRV